MEEKFGDPSIETKKDLADKGTACVMEYGAATKFIIRNSHFHENNDRTMREFVEQEASIDATFRMVHQMSKFDWLTRVWPSSPEPIESPNVSKSFQLFNRRSTTAEPSSTDPKTAPLPATVCTSFCFDRSYSHKSWPATSSKLRLRQPVAPNPPLPLRLGSL